MSVEKASVRQPPLVAAEDADRVAGSEWVDPNRFG
jgi:hypothetical protein